MLACVHVHPVVESLIAVLLFPLEPSGSRTMVSNGASGKRSSLIHHENSANSQTAPIKKKTAVPPTATSASTLSLIHI